LALFGVLGLLSAGVVMGFLILAGSTAFFTGRAEFGEFSFHTIVLLGSYPVDIFSGVARVMMFTVVPAAFVATIPARLVVDFSWANAASLAAVSALFLSAGAVAFHAGLRRYTSGALWTRA
jgi:ABC-2 type transport system permease protein